MDVGLQTAIFYLPSVAIRPVAGWLTDRFGRLKVIWGGTCFMIATALSLLLLRGSYDQMKVWMAVILFLRGTGFAAFYTAFFTYAADLSAPQNRARVIGMFGVSGLVAHGMAPRTAEMVLHHWQFPGFFVASAILAGLSLLITLFLAEQATLHVSDETGFAIVRRVTWSIRNLIVLPGGFVFGYAIASFTTFGAPYFLAAGGMTAGSFFLTYGLVAGGCRILFGGIADRISRWKLIAIFFALESVGLSLIVVDPAHIYAIAGAAICGLAHSILFPTMTAMAVDAHPAQYRGIVTSVFTATIELGFSLGSYFLGYIVAVLGYKPMFLIAGSGGLLFAAYTILVGLRVPVPGVSGHLTRLPDQDHT